MTEIRESIRRLADAFAISERRASAYVAELSSSRVDPRALENVVGFAIRNLERCPTIADLLARVSAQKRNEKLDAPLRKMEPEEAEVGIKILKLWRGGIVYDHAIKRWTQPGEKPTPLTREERDAMRLEGWRPPMPPFSEIHARHAQMQSDQRKPKPPKTEPKPDPFRLEVEIPF